MRIFITGGSGFVGRATIAHLVAAGHEVLALARSDASAEAVRALGAQPVQGDLLAQPLPDLCGAQALVHAAAPVVFWGPWSMYEREVVQASLAWYRHAAGQGVRRFIQISSESVLQGRGALLDIDESQPVADPPNSDYGRAKLAAERALQDEAARQAGCELIVLRPSFVWGPGVPALQTLLAKVRAGQFSWIDHGRTPFERVHVDNLALAIECALTRGTPGGTYLLTDDGAGSVRDTLAPLIAAEGVAVPTRSLPGAVARPLAALIEGMWRTLGLWRTAPPLTRFDLAFVSQPRRYRIDRARRELGYAPRAYRPQDGGRAAPAEG